MVPEHRLAFMGIALWVGLCLLVMVSDHVGLGVLGIVVLLAVSDFAPVAPVSRHREEGRRSSSTSVV